MSKEKEFVPFGPEWEKEIMKLPKAFIIKMLKEKSIYCQFIEQDFEEKYDSEKLALWIRSLIVWESGIDGDKEDKIIGFDFVELDKHIKHIMHYNFAK